MMQTIPASTMRQMLDVLDSSLEDTDRAVREMICANLPTVYLSRTRGQLIWMRKYLLDVAVGEAGVEPAELVQIGEAA